VYSLEKFRSILVRNQRIRDYVSSRLGPMYTKDVAEMFNISQTALNYALSKGEGLGEMSRGKRGTSSKTGREILDDIPKHLPLRDEAQYAMLLRRIANDLENADIFNADGAG